SAADAVGDHPQMDRRLRAARIATTRSHAGSRGVAAAAIERSALHPPRDVRSRAMMTRREFVAVAAAAAGWSARGVGRAAGQSFGAAADARARAIGVDGTIAASVEIVRDCDGSYCRARAVNRGSSAVRVKEIVLFDMPLAMPPQTALYGEGFQMLSQTGGTLAQPAALSQYTDAGHYKM